uniref:Transducer of ERBB2, 2 n=1 Tax=Oryzias melastigma TaxID=30732 RepID=A0A3B3D4Q4_ORYME
MHLEVKVALNFIVSYLYNKLPRRRADLFGEELERILVSRFEGHWYPEAPMRGSAFRCIHLGAQRDPVVELAAKRSGLDTEEVRANVPAELSVWIDPYEVSYQIGEQGAVKVLYLEDPPEAEEAKTMGFNPDAQVFVPVGSQVSPALLPSLSSSPTPLSSQPSTTLPPTRPQPMTFTTASFAATKFGSTKMKKMHSRSPTAMSAPELIKHKPLSLSLHSLGAPMSSQLSPNAKEFVYPGSPGPLFFDADSQPIQSHASPFHGGGISYMEKPPFVEGLGSYSLQYPSQSFQPVVLAN